MVSGYFRFSFGYHFAFHLAMTFGVKDNCTRNLEREGAVLNCWVGGFRLILMDIYFTIIGYFRAWLGLEYGYQNFKILH